MSHFSMRDWFDAMKDIRFLGTEGDYLLLEDANGQKFRLLLDNTLKNVVRGERQEKLDDVSISPRQIQEEIRIGRTIEEVVANSGAPEEYVRKFAQPVLDELNHAVLNALTVRLEVAGDRFTEPTAREFGEIIKTRLAASGAGMEKWSALKAPDHGFFIHCEFELEGENKKATWSYDPRRLALAPENDIAISLSSQERIGNRPSARLQPVPSLDNSMTANLGDTVDLATVLPKPQRESLSPPPEGRPVVPMSETADLLDALRKKRNEREMNVTDLESHPATDALRIVEIETSLEIVEKDLEESVNTDVNSEEASAAETGLAKKGRASIPSWDEIVFGTKTED
jgi:hypothetical protein